MVSSTVSRGAAATGALGLAGVSIFGASTASAAPADCAYPGSTEVVAGVCQVVITADGVYTFPSTLTKVSAVVVGAGGGGYLQVLGAGPYGGGGGEVLYVDSVALDTPITVDIGDGGTAGSDDTVATDGDDTTFGAVTARGGLAPVPSDPQDPAGSTYDSTAASGNGNEALLSGGGAAGDAGNPGNYDVGPGYLLSAIPGVNAALFPASADGGVEYGRGGTALSTDSATSITPPVPHSGTGGSAYQNYEVDAGDSADGDDGVVILRYAAAPELAATGTDPAGALLLGGATAVLGAGMIAGSAAARRCRRAN
jgi:hypothetical protein